MKRSSVTTLLVVSVVLCPMSDTLVSGAATGWEAVDWMYQSLITLMYFCLVFMLYDFVKSS